jgi:hypothetical protein
VVSQAVFPCQIGGDCGLFGNDLILHPSLSGFSTFTQHTMSIDALHAMTVHPQCQDCLASHFDLGMSSTLGRMSAHHDSELWKAISLAEFQDFSIMYVSRKHELVAREHTEPPMSLVQLSIGEENVQSRDFLLSPSKMPSSGDCSV